MAREYPPCFAGMGTPCRRTPTLGIVEASDDFSVDDFLTELAEISVGTALLGLRRMNIERRKLVEQRPGLAPLVDGLLDQVEAMAEPVSAIAGAVVAGIGDAVAGERGERLTQAGQTVSEMGPELLRLSGLTKRS